MDSILDRLYISELRSKENISSTGKDKEEQLYDKLENTLTKEQKELFDEFLEELEARRDLETEEYFKTGFRQGVRLFIECFT